MKFDSLHDVSVENIAEHLIGRIAYWTDLDDNDKKELNTLYYAILRLRERKHDL
jgi:hypothetical protein